MDFAGPLYEWVVYHFENAAGGARSLSEPLCGALRTTRTIREIRTARDGRPCLQNDTPAVKTLALAFEGQMIIKEMRLSCHLRPGGRIIACCFRGQSV
jgi:hypothetical protein